MVQDTISPGLTPPGEIPAMVWWFRGRHECGKPRHEHFGERRYRRRSLVQPGKRDPEERAADRVLGACHQLLPTV